MSETFEVFISNPENPEEFINVHLSDSFFTALDVYRIAIESPEYAERDIFLGVQTDTRSRVIYSNKFNATPGNRTRQAEFTDAVNELISAANLKAYYDGTHGTENDFEDAKVKVFDLIRTV